MPDAGQRPTLPTLPTGPSRRPRRTDADTRARMLTAALDQLAEQGVSVGLDGLLLEDVIRRADVSRTSAYRRWPTRDAFLADVLLEVARGTDLPGVGARVTAEAQPLLDPRTLDVSTPAARHGLFVELLRLSFQADLDGIAASPSSPRTSRCGPPSPASPTRGCAMRSPPSWCAASGAPWPAAPRSCRARPACSATGSSRRSPARRATTSSRGPSLP
ncbi:hypothetical protein [Cellulomonas soli]